MSFRRIGDWNCGEHGRVRYAEHRLHPEWRVALTKDGVLTSQYGGIQIPFQVVHWLFRRLLANAFDVGADAALNAHDIPVNPYDNEADPA